jgi:hypothetical protein
MEKKGRKKGKISIRSINITDKTSNSDLKKYIKIYNKIVKKSKDIKDSLKSESDFYKDLDIKIEEKSSLDKSFKNIDKNLEDLTYDLLEILNYLNARLEVIEKYDK